MKAFHYILFTLFALCGNAQLKTPSAFLPHDLGAHFTPHHYLVDYFEYVSEVSDQVNLVEYGRTNQDRPLIAAFVSSKKNLARLEEIRKKNLSRAGYDIKSSLQEDIAIVWLSFSVHGNEAAGTESAYKVLYDLANTENKNTQEWLKNTVVIIDPALNPDGYSRYVHWIRNYSGNATNLDQHDAEHHEPWPGGRSNHYNFDLNRDWAWQTQVESQQRMKLYHQWLPHVHADLHEMGAESPYYFAPAAEPFHQEITDWQRQFQTDIGKNHAKYFDQQGWLYYTKEIFDLFYPSYGDTYPTFNGAVGMTYEQGGSTWAGRAYKMNNGEVLTLKDRINHHLTTALSTVEISSKNADKLIKEFEKYYQRNNNSGQSYIIKNSDDDRLQSLANLLDKQGIKYGYCTANTSASGMSYESQRKATFEIEKGDMVISSNQQKSTLLTVLMEAEPKLVDSLTYDITSWALPYAYGLDAYKTDRSIGSVTTDKSQKTPKLLEQSYAYVIPNGSTTRYALLAELHKKNIKIRVAEKDFKSNGESYETGSWIVTKADNAKIGNLLSILNSIQKRFGVSLSSIQTGFSDSGPDVGSGSMQLLKAPKIAVLMGNFVSQYSFGQIRHFFEQRINYPISMIDITRWQRTDLNSYDVLIIPDGQYRFSEGDLELLGKWARSGGKIIAISHAISAFANTKGFGIKTKKAEKKDSTKVEKQPIYSARERHRISTQSPGVVINTSIDQSHPYMYGMERYYSLKTNTLFFDKLSSGNNIAWVTPDAMTSGFIGATAKQRLDNSLIFGSEAKGRGSIVYLVDNPLFRGFWEAGNKVFAQAVFFQD